MFITNISGRMLKRCNKNELLCILFDYYFFENGYVSYEQNLFDTVYKNITVKQIRNDIYKIRRQENV